MYTQNLGTFVCGLGTGILLTTALSGVYCLYIKQRRSDKSCSEKCNPCKCDPCKCDPCEGKKSD